MWRWPLEPIFAEKFLKNAIASVEGFLFSVEIITEWLKTASLLDLKSYIVLRASNLLTFWAASHVPRTHRVGGLWLGMSELTSNVLGITVHLVHLG